MPHQRAGLLHARRVIERLIQDGTAVHLIPSDERSAALGRFWRWRQMVQVANAAVAANNPQASRTIEATAPARWRGRDS